MFERFTDRARRVVVYAQEEARQFDHNYIGTEHILLGILHEGEGIGAKALKELAISLDAVRASVEEIIGHGPSAPSGHIPFTPRAKKVLELSLREALQLGHNYIGTEHILLGLIREGEGVAAQVLVGLGLTLSTVRQKVIELLSRLDPPGSAMTGAGMPMRRPPGSEDVDEGVGTTREFGTGPARVACSFCGSLPSATSELFGGERAAFICGRCVREAQAMLEENERVARGEPPTAADESDVLWPVPPGVVERTTPMNSWKAAYAAQVEISQAFGDLFDGAEATGDLVNVDGGEGQGHEWVELCRDHPSIRTVAIRIDAVNFFSDTGARVPFVVSIDDEDKGQLDGMAKQIDGRWRVTTKTLDAVMELLQHEANQPAGADPADGEDDESAAE